MAGWFARLMGLPTQAAQAQPAPRAAAVAPAPVTAPAPAPAPAPLPAVQFGVRRPLVGKNGSLAGFEVLLPPALEQRLAWRTDPAALVAHQALLLAAAAPVCKAGRVAVLQLTAAALVRPAVAQQAVPGTMLCVDDLVQLPADLTGMLRARGVQLGVPDGPPGAAVAADFVLMRAAQGGLDTLMLSAQRWRATQPRLAFVAADLEQLDDVESLLRSGFALAGGVLDRGAASRLRRPLSAAAHRICELLNHLALDRDTDVVADAVRADVALSYRLLRYANSPALGLRRSVEAVNDAVMLLGREELQRWLSVLLISAAESRQASRALQETALARGRLLERLAQQRQEPAPQRLFTLGMLSLLEVLLQCPLADALRPLKLSEPVHEALLQDQGPYAAYLRLAKALDSGDDAVVETLAAPFGGLEPVQAMAAEAWLWAQEMARTATAAD